MRRTSTDRNANTIDASAAAAQTVASDGSRPYFESLEAMRVELQKGTANSGGTDKFGELFVQPTTKRKRVLRDPNQTAGPANLLNITQDAGSADADPTNPSANPASTTRVNADLFDGVRNVIGPLGFDFSEYGTVPQPGHGPKVVSGPTLYPPQTEPAQAAAIRISEFNMENLFGVGMVDDGHTLTQAETDAKTTRLANAIKLMHDPEVLSVEEVASSDWLQEVDDKLGDRYQVFWLRPTTRATSRSGSSSRTASR